MVLGYHVIFCAYGFWLPNDPRGSWSDYIRAWEVLQYGGASTTDTRRSVAGRRHDRTQREDAKRALKYPPVTFTGVQARAVGRGFAEANEKGGYVMFACSIMPQHVHVVVGRHEQKIEQVVTHLKGRATQHLRREGLHPFAPFVKGNEAVPCCWAQGSWPVYLNSADDIDRAVRYVEANPMKEGLPPQRWPYVTAWDETWVDRLRAVRQARPKGRR